MIQDIMDFLSQADPEVGASIQKEFDREQHNIELIASCSKQRKEVVPSTASYGIGVTTAYPLEVTVGGATVWGPGGC